MTDDLSLDALEPRIRRMLLLIMRNRAEICDPSRGVVELHFRGAHVSARLISPQALTLDNADGDHLEAS